MVLRKENNIARKTEILSASKPGDVYSTFFGHQSKEKLGLRAWGVLGDLLRLSRRAAWRKITVERQQKILFRVLYGRVMDGSLESKLLLAPVAEGKYPEIEKYVAARGMTANAIVEARALLNAAHEHAQRFGDYSWERHADPRLDRVSRAGRIAFKGFIPGYGAPINEFGDRFFFASMKLDVLEREAAKRRAAKTKTD